ncbi:helix-turn-helix domain-containing protein [Actinokineospora sp. 24-640]
MRVAGLESQVARRLLRFELELWCSRSGVTHAELGARLGISRASVTQFLTGKNLLSRAALEVMLSYLGAEHRLPVLTEILTIARSGRNPGAAVCGYVGGAGWWVLDGALAVGLEAVSDTIEVYDTSVITPLLRTGDYTRCLAEAFGGQLARVDDERWSRRRETISADASAQLCWVVQEQVLYREVGDARVMADQCAHLVEMSKRPNVSVRVVPASVGVHSGLTGAFQVYRSPEWFVVCQETRTAAHYYTDPATVADCLGVLADLRLAALNTDQSRGRLIALGEGWRAAS